MAWLLSDYLIWGFAFVIVFSICLQTRTRTERQFWKMLTQQRMTVAALVILAFFMLLTLSDSWHTQGNTHTAIASDNPSLLDRWLPKAAQDVELTYSAPFATHSYQAQLKRNKQGRIDSQYTPLNIMHQHMPKVRHLMWIGFLWGVLYTISLTLITFILACLWRRESPKQWLMRYRQGASTLHTIWTCIAIVLIVSSAVYHTAGVYHVLGTDQVGQDILAQTLKSVRTGIIIGTLSTISMLPMALLFGLLAGYCRGWVDDVIQYIYTTLSAIPGVLLISAGILVMQMQLQLHPTWFHSLAQRADIRLVGLCLILGLSSWANLCRLIRAETLKIKSLDYIAAAQMLKLPFWRILARHILPNCMHIILITIALDFSGLVLAEAVLSYVGVGVDPTTSSWGNMINSARLEMAREPLVWWPLLAAMILMFLLVLSANIFADALRDALDPRLRSTQEEPDS